MIRLTEYINKRKDVKLMDLLHFFLLPIAGFCAFFLRRKYPNIWLICEDKNEARDNGYWFYKYVVENHPEQFVVYAINKNSSDYKKVKNLGKIIQYGGLIHWIYYLASKRLISSQKGGKPNAPCCRFLEMNGLVKNSRIFLQHGITFHDGKWLYYENTKFDMFICAVRPEVQLIKTLFHYPEEKVKLTGFSRFDNLLDANHGGNVLLVMPTWRSWLVLPSKSETGKLENFADSEYFLKWNDFLNSKELEDIARINNLKILFFPHRGSQKFLNSFNIKNQYVETVYYQDMDIQVALKESALMITDYSSVFWDFIYMKKPVILYQFDLEKFSRLQYSHKESYLDYENNPFLKAFRDKGGVINEINACFKNGFSIDDKFLKAHKEYFPYYDTENSRRIYDSIKEMEIKNELI